MKKLFMVILFTAYCLMCWGQNSPRYLLGKVVNEEGDPLYGTIISSIHSSVKTLSDQDGYFRMILGQREDSIVVSFMGYAPVRLNITAFATKTLSSVDRITPRKVCTIVLHSKAKDMDSISLKVNTGYQYLGRERATGSYSLITGKDLELQTGSSILDRIKGMAPSVLFDDGKIKSTNKKLNFNIRGLSTINAGQDPLIILDNFPYDGDIDNIDPNTIASITLLKDAAASSIWGARAGNGVVVITTKKASAGKMKTTINATLQWSAKPDLYRLHQLSSKDYVDMEAYLFEQGYYDSKFNNPSYPVVTPVQQTLEDYRSGILTQEQKENLLNGYRQNDLRSAYTKDVLRRGLLQQYGITLTGGNDKIRHLASFNYQQDKDQQSTPSQKAVWRWNTIFTPISNVQLTVNAMYTQQKAKNGLPSYSAMTTGGVSVPYLRLKDDMGQELPFPVSYSSRYTDTAGGGRLMDWNYYPLSDYLHNRTENNKKDYYVNASLQYSPMQGWNLQFRYQVEQQQTSTTNLADTASYYTRNLINTYSQILPSGAINNIVTKGDILSREEAQILTRNARLQTDYGGDFGGGRLNILAGAEIRETKVNSNGYTVYGYNSEILTNANVNFATPYPSYVNGFTSYIPSGISEAAANQRFVSVFGNGAYTWKQRYTVSASFRKDASNIFGLNTNDKWNPLWSTGILWNLDRESFYHWSVLPGLKLRLTYGVSGNIDPSKSALTVIQYTGTDIYTGLTKAAISQLPNPDLKWESSAMLNIGVDFSSKNNVISGSLEYYHKKGSNLYGSYPYDYTAGSLGTPYLTKNIAAMAANGIDIDLQTKNISNRGFVWNTHWMVSYNDTKTKKYFYQNTLMSADYVGSGTTITPIVGKPLYSIGSYKWAGLDPNNGDPRGYLNDVVSKDYMSMEQDTTLSSLAYAGSASPLLFGSLINSWNWKGFSLSVAINFKLFYYFRRNSLNYNQLFANGIGHEEYAHRWQKTGDENKTAVPSMIYPADNYRDVFYNYSQQTIEKADHVRLQFVNLSYEFHPKGYSTCQVFVNASNLGILWSANHKGLDPEYEGSYPSPKTFSVGFKSTF